MLMDDETILSGMSRGDKRVVMFFAKANMRVNEAARLAYLSRDSVKWRLNRVRNNTGYNPFEFHDLARLVRAIEDERRENDKH